MPRRVLLAPVLLALPSAVTLPTAALPMAFTLPMMVALPTPGWAQPAALVWPRTFDAGAQRVEIYQPQIDTWEGTRVAGRAAFAVGDPKSAPTYGVATFESHVAVDKGAGLALLDSIRITGVDLPTDTGRTEELRSFLQGRIPKQGMQIGLEQLAASYATSQQAQAAPTVDVKNDPPKVLVTNQPTVLLVIDGAPALRPVAGTVFRRIINTPALLLRDDHSVYASVAGLWYMAPSLDGPWSVLGAPPPSLAAAATAAAKEQPYDKMAGKPGAQPPAIMVASSPAELIVTQGPPEFGPIPGTSLQALRNADHAVLMDTDQGRTYVLLSGRWFAAPSLDGPWTFVPGESLPADFRKIPPDDPAANVLVSVPGTPQAREAVIAASIPQTATVTRATAKLTVPYSGEPKFAPVTGTQLSYAQNTATPVLRTPENAFYALSGGVWFVAPTASGPWHVADTVPPSIYAIPPASPLYYVTYVRVYQATPTTVVVGYTPGYLGVVVGPGGTVVYGTGYVYPAYLGPVWYGYPPTYGYGAGFALGATEGFAFGFAAGAIAGAVASPYWGPYAYHGAVGWGGVNVNHVNVYNSWGGSAHVTTAAGWRGATAFHGSSVSTFNPYNGRQTVSQQGAAHNYATGAEGVGRRTGSYNPTTGVATASREGAGYNPQTGKAGAGQQNAWNTDNRVGASSRSVSGTVGSGTATTTNRGVSVNKNTGNAVGWNNGDVYADHNGNVYSHQNGSWQQHSSNGWQSVDRANPSVGSLEQERRARDTGGERSWGGGGWAPRGGGWGGRDFRR
jgi:hypothetical protein